MQKMIVAIEQQSESELIGDIIERSLECLSEKLGRDERVFWALVAISRGDAKAPKTLKVSDLCINTLEVAESLVGAMLLRTMNGKKMNRDIKTAKGFLDVIAEKVERQIEE